jgi:hypothetical protein
VASSLLLILSLTTNLFSLSLTTSLLLHHPLVDSLFFFLFGLLSSLFPLLGSSLGLLGISLSSHYSILSLSPTVLCVILFSDTAGFLFLLLSNLLLGYILLLLFCGATPLRRLLLLLCAASLRLCLSSRLGLARQSLAPLNFRLSNAPAGFLLPC